MLYWGLGYNKSRIRSVPNSTKTIFAVLDVSLIMGLNIGETDKVFFYINHHHHQQQLQQLQQQQLVGRWVGELYSRHDDVFEELWNGFGEHEDEHLERQHRHARVLFTTSVDVLRTETEHSVLERPLSTTFNITTVSPWRYN